MNSFLILVAVIAIISFGYMLFNFFKVKKLEEQINTANKETEQK